MTGELYPNPSGMGRRRSNFRSYVFIHSEHLTNSRGEDRNRGQKNEDALPRIAIVRGITTEQ
jgi:hypothetical protein